MKIGNLPHQRKPQSRAAVLPAAGLVHAEEWLEDALLILLRDAADLVRSRGLGDVYKRQAWAIVFDGIFCQVEEQPVDQRVAAGHDAVAIRRQRDAALIC